MAKNIIRPLFVVVAEELAQMGGQKGGQFDTSVIDD